MDIIKIAALYFIAGVLFVSTATISARLGVIHEDLVRIERAIEASR